MTLLSLTSSRCAASHPQALSRPLLARRALRCHAYTPRKGEDEGETMLSLAPYLAERQGEAAPGVYAVYDSSRALQYVGWGTDIFAQLRHHASALGEEQASHVRVQVFGNTAMATAVLMRQESERWVSEGGGVVPPGNGVDARLWALPGDATATPASINGAPPSGDVVVSPFSQAQVHRTVGQTRGAEGAAMTLESVDAALDEVRPFLRSDGGDVRVVAVEGGTVRLQLEGNCGTCSSSSATMSMGIERSLRAAFGDQLREVVQVDSAAATSGTSVKAVNDLLNMLRPAIANYGGSVEVLSLSEGGVCRVSYKGPEPIWNGVRAAIRDKFTDVTDIQRA